MNTGGALDRMIEATALALARKERLVDEKGQIWCRYCNERLALLPSLACPPCLGAAYSRLRITSPLCINRRQACDPDSAQQRQEVA